MTFPTGDAPRPGDPDPYPPGTPEVAKYCEWRPPSRHQYPKGGGHGTMPYAPGGMGVHFLNLQLIGPALDPAKPQVLIYEPDGDQLRLVAAEWFVPVQAAGAVRPTIFGRELEGPMEGHKPLMPAGLHHYDLHVWLCKENPAGTFAPTNPAVMCPKRGYSFAESAPRLVPHQGHESTPGR